MKKLPENISLPLIIFFLFAVMPLVVLFFRPFIAGISQGLSAEDLFLIGNSVLFSVLVAFFSTVGGLFFSVVFFFHHSNLVRYIKLLLILPLFITPYSFAVSWNHISVFSGLQPYIKMFILYLITYIPLAFLILTSSLSVLPDELLEASYIQATASKTIKKIVIPYLKPALLTSFTLVFIFGISEFTVPVYFNAKLFSAKIFTEFSAFYDYESAVFHSFILIVFVGLILIAENNLFREVPLFSLSLGKNKRTISLKQRWFIVFSILYVLVFIVLPLFLLSKGAVADVYVLMKAFTDLLPAMWSSVLISFVTAIVSVITVIATLIVSFIKSRKTTGGFYFLLPFAVPSIILGIAFIYFYNTKPLFFIYSSAAILILGLVARYSYLAYKINGNLIKAVDYSLIESARLHNFSRYKIARHIILPELLPGILVSGFIVFIFSFLETDFTIMVYPPGMQLASVKVYTLMSNASGNYIDSLNFILILSSLFFSFFFMAGYKFFRKNNRSSL